MCAAVCDDVCMLHASLKRGYHAMPLCVLSQTHLLLMPQRKEFWRAVNCTCKAISVWYYLLLCRSSSCLVSNIFNRLSLISEDLRRWFHSSVEA